ncbi:MAG TPA: XdhC family protein [Candidatus Cybelea sp.]|jgi:xanthine dehydrogenase accessory factor
MNGRLFLERAAELERARTPFVLATVVARRAPVSAHLGDRAIVLADGTMQGFVGGSCSREIVRRQSLAALRNWTARLVQIRPGAPPDADDASAVGTVVVPMSCASEGAVDVYVEPHFPPRVLLVAGFTPVAERVAALGALLDGYRVVRVVQAEEAPGLEADRVVGLNELPDFLDSLDRLARDGLVAVVATQGHYDEAVLAALLARDAVPYVGLLGSRRRAAELFADLRRRGISADGIARVRNPAGLDIGARRPGDVAISILGEIVATVASLEPAVLRPDAPLEESAADPVCGMDVRVAASQQRAEHHGQAYYFCGEHCRSTFLSDPARYAVAAHA